MERGAADIGVAGKDILLEYEPRCVRAAGPGRWQMPHVRSPRPKDFRDDPADDAAGSHKISEHIARQLSTPHRAGEIDIIHLNGSIELAPILGLADVIVDIVETGKTLLENDLEPLGDHLSPSARG